MKITTRVAGGVVRVTTATEGHHPDRFGNDAATFTSSFDIVEAMKDPRYQTSPSYRREVELKIARSGVAEVTDASAVAGRFQTSSEEQLRQQADQRAQSIGLGEHEAAMIAKAEKHGV
jgi:hypothetical protein